MLFSLTARLAWVVVWQNMLVVVEMNFPLDLFLVAVGATDIQMAIPALAPLRQPFSALSMHFVFFFFFLSHLLALRADATKNYMVRRRKKGRLTYITTLLCFFFRPQLALAEMHRVTPDQKTRRPSNPPTTRSLFLICFLRLSLAPPHPHPHPPCRVDASQTAST